MLAISQAATSFGRSNDSSPRPNGEDVGGVTGDPDDGMVDRAPGPSSGRVELAQQLRARQEGAEWRPGQAMATPVLTSMHAISQVAHGPDQAERVDEEEEDAAAMSDIAAAGAISIRLAQMTGWVSFTLMLQYLC